MGNFFNTIILTTAVIAALITSLANIFISLINNHRLKRMEEKKQMNEIDKYRYSMLYNLIVNWDKYDAKEKGETVEKIAYYKLLNLFMDDSKRYNLAKPLLDEYYIKDLEIKKNICKKLLDELVLNETPDGKHTAQFPIIRNEYFKNGQEFSELLKKSINNQLIDLLRKK